MIGGIAKLVCRNTRVACRPLMAPVRQIAAGQMPVVEASEASDGRKMRHKVEDCLRRGSPCALMLAKLPACLPARI